MPSPKRTVTETVREAVAALRDGTGPRPDLADAVEQLAAQRLRGWAGAEGDVVSFRADSELLARVGDGRLSQVAADGCERFLAGELAPVRTVRAAADTKKRTSVRLPAGLLARVEARCAEQSPCLGWTVRPVNVIVAAFQEDAAVRE